MESVTDFLSVKERPEPWELEVIGVVDGATTEVIAVESKCKFLARLRVVRRISELSNGIDTVETTG